jgi:hypothetical protein
MGSLGICRLIHFALQSGYLVKFFLALSGLWRNHRAGVQNSLVQINTTAASRLPLLSILKLPLVKIWSLFEVLGFMNYSLSDFLEI